MPGGKKANLKNEKQYEALKDKGMSKERAAKIPNSPGASKRGGKSSGKGGDSSQGGTTAQQKKDRCQRGHAAQMMNARSDAGTPSNRVAERAGATLRVPQPTRQSTSRTCSRAARARVPPGTRAPAAPGRPGASPPLTDSSGMGRS